MKQTEFFIFSMALIATIATSIFSCKKDAHKPPVVEFKTGSGLYTVKGNNLDTLLRNTTYTIGLKVTKVEDELKSLNVSVAYDGAATSTSVYNASTSHSQYDGFEDSRPIATRNQAGIEKFTFAVTDFDGNIGLAELTVIVK
jgi:hypothetical protein